MIKRAEKEDKMILARLAGCMWNEHSTEELAEEFLDLMEREDAQLFLQYDQELPIGFAQCQLRHDYVEGCHSSPVGYLEGIFIREPYRRKGYARELLEQCERWALEKGCTEFASDCEWNNTDSIQFHLAEGFEEAGHIRCFVKKIE